MFVQALIIAAEAEIQKRNKSDTCKYMKTTEETPLPSHSFD